MCRNNQHWEEIPKWIDRKIVIFMIAIWVAGGLWWWLG